MINLEDSEKLRRTVVAESFLARVDQPDVVRAVLAGYPLTPELEVAVPDSEPLRVGVPVLLHVGAALLDILPLPNFRIFPATLWMGKAPRLPARSNSLTIA